MLGNRLHDRLAPSADQDAVARLQHDGRLRPDHGAAAQDALDADVVPVTLFDVADGLPRAAGHLQLAPDERRRREALAFAQRAVAAELAPEALGFVAKIHAQDERRELAREQHDRDEPEQVAHAVRGDDVGLQARGFGGGEAEPADRLRRRADHRGFGRGSREQAGRRALVELEHGDKAKHERDHDNHLDDRQDAVAPAAADIGEKLRTARKAERENK